MSAGIPLAPVLVAALALAAPAARGAERAPGAPRLALDELQVVGVSPALADLVEERLCAALGEAGEGEVVCPADVQAATALAKTSMMFGECATEECLRRAVAVRSADRRVGGTLERGEKAIVLSLQLSASGAAAGPRVVETLPEDLDALVARIPAIVKKLFPGR